jgi:hypothetical protein
LASLVNYMVSNLGINYKLDLLASTLIN